MHASPQFALLLTRLGFGLFLAIWGANKLLNPQGTQRIFEVFYGWSGLGTSMSVLLGALQIVLGLAIMTGFVKTISYGLGVLIHAVSTFATLSHLLMPFAKGSNLLFFAAVPVLLAAVGLFLAREADTLFNLDEYRKGRR